MNLNVGGTAHVALWDAINALVDASGGRNGVSTARMTSVANVESALRAALAEAAAPVALESVELLSAHCRKVQEDTRYACSIAVWMTLQEAMEPGADDKGLDGWMREAERRVRFGPPNPQEGTTTPRRELSERDGRQHAHEARRWCSGDSAWSEWQPCTAEQAASYAKDETFQVRAALRAAGGEG